MIRQFDSISALRTLALQRHVLNDNPGSSWADLSWYGNETPSQTIRLSETGDTSLVPAAEVLIDQLETQIEVPRRIWEPSPSGAFCVVPDVLAGLPTYMRRQREVGNEYSPISIYVRPNASASITADQLRQRGTTILALVMALARSRPISLHYYFVGDGGFKSGSRDGCRETVLAARIETAPLDLASACYVLSSSGFYRRMCMRLGTSLNEFSGGAVISLSRCEQIAFSLMGLDPKNTLIIGPVVEGEPLLNEPVKWLNTQITRFTTAQDEDFQ